MEALGLSLTCLTIERQQKVLNSDVRFLTVFEWVRSYTPNGYLRIDKHTNRDLIDSESQAGGLLMVFAGRAVLITGSSRGIGEATARAFLSDGARVAINGRTEDSVCRAIEELDCPDRLVGVPGDVSTMAACDAVVNAAVEALGGLDVLVNSAGVFTQTPMVEMDEKLWDSLFDINVKGTYFCSRAALPALQLSKGSIVNVASESGLNGYAGETAYCASKGAVVNLTRAMALELAPRIRVNCICPGIIDTDMARAGFSDLSEAAKTYPLKRIGTAAEVAKGILYLASPDAAFITGSALAMDGGATAGIA